MPRQLRISGTEIDIIKANGGDYFSLTDIAKFRSEDPNMTIRQWISTKDTLAFLATWEGLNNSHFDREGHDSSTREAGTRAYSISPSKWIRETNAIGIVSKHGRGGGTHAHIDIALEFASYLSPAFRLYIITEYKRLRAAEETRSLPEWKLSREIAKINNRIQTDAIKQNLIPEGLSKEQAGYQYASEADLLNVVVFGMTAKQWQRQNPGSRENMRESASLSQLLVLNNLLGQNAAMIDDGIPQTERMQKLRSIAIKQLQSLESVDADKKLLALEPNSGEATETQ